VASEPSSLSFYAVSVIVLVVLVILYIIGIFFALTHFSYQQLSILRSRVCDRYVYNDNLR
jgi:hypothetical protein